MVTVSMSNWLANTWVTIGLSNCLAYVWVTASMFNRLMYDLLLVCLEAIQKECPFKKPIF